jgi:UDP-4-amino-4,6-dideoxy-N-acetyl-beta-L-altrosamine transaminase
MIPYGRQDVTEEDIRSVVEILRSDYLTQGPAVPAFENAVASFCHVKYAVATNSATSSLHIACLALGVGPGDRVWTTPITFVASANCALYCGAVIDFVDIDPRTYTMSAERLEEKLARAETKNTLPKVVIPVHLAGQSCDMQKIHALSLRYGFTIIEDASHAIGGYYKGEPIGNCKYSDITVFSFHPVKIITTGEGGMALTNDAFLSSSMALFRSHGITRDPDLMTHPPDGAWYYQQIALGFNYRMTDIQAALGLSQLNRLEEYVKKRVKLVEGYQEHLSGQSILLPWQHPDSYSAHHLYIVLVQDKRDQVFESMRKMGVGVNLHYIPVHTQPYFSAMGFREGDFPESEAYYSKAISLPMYPTLSEVQQGYVIDCFKKALQE